MAKFICKSCDNTKELRTYSLGFVKGEKVYKEAVCEFCDIYMDMVPEDKGFGGIIKKPNGTVSGKF